MMLALSDYGESEQHFFYQSNWKPLSAGRWPQSGAKEPSASVEVGTGLEKTASGGEDISSVSVATCFG